MIRTLLKLDPAVPTLRFTVPIALVAGLVQAALAARVLENGETVATVDGSEGLRFVYAQMWIIALMFAIASRFTARCAQMSLSLPLDPRELWVARMISISYAALLPLFIMTSLASAHGLIFSEEPSIDTYVWRLGATAASSLIFVFALVQSPSPGLYMLRGTWKYISCMTMASIALLATVLFGPRSALVTLGFLAAAAVLAIIIYRSLPSSFTVAPTALGKARGISRQTALRAGPAPVRSPGGRLGFHILLNLSIFRLVVNHPVSWIMLPTAAFYGILIPEKYYEGKDVLPYLVVVFVWVTAMLFQAIIRMKDLDSLPVSRERLFAYSILPTVAAFALGIGISYILVGAEHIKPSMVRYKASVVVPIEFWELAGDEGPPEITAPWGESYAPKARPLFRGSGTYLYNPFEHGEDNSYKFIDYQLRRAVEAVNGVPAPSDEEFLRSEPGAMFSEQVDSCCFTAAGSEWKGSGRRSGVFATGCMLTVLLVSVIYSLGMQQFRAVLHAGAYALFLQLAFLPILVLLGVLVISEVAGLADFHLATSYPQILTRRLADALPLGTGLLWTLTVAATFGGYSVVLWRFKKIELPNKCCKKKSLGDY